jgi:hypothetical protein
LEPDHEKVLDFLVNNTSEEGCAPFAPICKATRLPRARVRFICRLFKRKGWAEFYSGLFDDDGKPAGSGYCVTKAGIAAWEALPQDGIAALQSV